MAGNNVQAENTKTTRRFIETHVEVFVPALEKDRPSKVMAEAIKKIAETITDKEKALTSAAG
jgi:ribosomal protein L28